jgi:protein SCO1/2
VLLTSAALVLLSGCAPARPEARQYELRGQILAIRFDAREVLIKHGDIKNFMPGMTMPFKVKDAALLAGKAPGDLVTAQLIVADTEAWIATLEKTGAAPIAEASSIPPASFVAPVKVGDSVPDTALVDQDGRTISRARWRDAAVVLTFIYIRCPLPQFCPLMDRRFAEVQQAIRADQRLAGRARLLSVSFDPEHDTPAALQAHAQKTGADPGVWRFATAPPDIVDRFAAAFGVNVIREQDRTITHNLRTAVIDPNGRVVSVYDGSDWTAAQVLDDLRHAVAR